MCNVYWLLLLDRSYSQFFYSIVYWFVRSFPLPGLERKLLASFNEIWQVEPS